MPANTYNTTARVIFAFAVLTVIAIGLFAFLYTVDAAVDGRTIVQPGDLSAWEGVYYVALLCLYLTPMFILVEAGIGIVVANGSDEASVTTSSPTKGAVTTSVPESGSTSIRVAGGVCGGVATLLLAYLVGVYGWMHDHCCDFNLCCDACAGPAGECACADPRNMFLAQLGTIIIAFIMSVVLFLTYVVVAARVLRFQA